MFYACITYEKCVVLLLHVFMPRKGIISEYHPKIVPESVGSLRSQTNAYEGKGILNQKLEKEKENEQTCNPIFFICIWIRGIEDKGRERRVIDPNSFICI